MAGCAGHIKAMKVAKEWGATNFNEALIMAGCAGHIKAMKLLKMWGADNFSETLKKAKQKGRTDCMKLLETWIDELANLQITLPQIIHD